MSEAETETPMVRSWRDIPQAVAPRAMSKTGRRRYMLATAKVICGTAFVAALAWCGYELVSTMENNPREIARTTQVGPLKEVTLATDGVLNKEWALRTLGIPKNATLMELDLPKLQAKLLASGQVKSALLSKSFPTTLVLSLSERSPVARIMVQESDQSKATYLVARDGVVYRGEGYADSGINDLPWLDGVRLARKNGVFSPIEGMEIVAELLSKARYEAAHLYPLFQIVNVARLQSDGEIEIRSRECESVIFSTTEDFFRQLAWFDSIRDMVKPTVDAPLAKVDLSLGRNAPVTFRQVVPVSAAGGKAQSGARTQPQASGPAVMQPRGQAPAMREVQPRQMTPLDGANGNFINLQRNTIKREL